MDTPAGALPGGGGPGGSRRAQRAHGGALLIAIDTNILVYAHRAELPQHRRALARLRDLAEGDAAWALPVFCVTEFARVVSHPRLFDPPMPTMEALAAIDALLASPSARLLHPGARFLPLLTEIARESQATGNLLHHAQIAALCLEHGASTLLSEDSDFLRFGSIRLERLR